MTRMRGEDRGPETMFSYVSAEQRVPKEHPLRAIRALVDDVLRDMSREFDGLYARVGRPSIPPERLLRAQLLQIFYSIRSERLLMEQLDYNLLFRWFVGMDMDEPIWDPTVFTKNRDRLLNQDIARSFFRRVVARAEGLMSDEHFTVDGTLIEAWASQKSFQRKDGGTDGDGSDFRGQQRKNDTHASKTDPDARLYRKSNGAESRLAYLGHLLIENRHGLIADATSHGRRAIPWRVPARQPWLTHQPAPKSSASGSCSVFLKPKRAPLRHSATRTSPVSTFTATSRPRRGSRPRYTSPLPPAPEQAVDLGRTDSRAPVEGHSKTTVVQTI